jgi:hypothetical protein
MTPTEFLQRFTEIFTASCGVSTLLMVFLPTTQEIPWKPYVIVYNMIQRLSLHRPVWDHTGDTNG